jgi:serine/threonine protein kinase
MLSLDGYSLEDKIRETPFAALYRGHRDANGEPVVVKALRSEHPGPVDLARLRHEFAILRSMDSPYVVRALALEKLGHALALVLEDVGEDSLDIFVEADDWSLEQRLQVAAALAGVVAAIHDHRIVHKDIKPHHFFVSPADQRSIKLIDFGIATRLSQEVQTASAVTRLEGSLPYIAPEQTGRMNRVIDRRSDLYSSV